MSKKATTGGAVDGVASLTNRPPKAVDLRGIGTLPNKRFSKLVPVYIACQDYQHVPINTIDPHENHKSLIMYFSYL